MRSLLACLFALALLPALAACGDAPAAAEGGASAVAPEAAPATDALASTDAPTAEAGSCCDEVGDAPEAGGVCVCEAGRAGAPVWCAACRRGWVDGKEASCPKCVQVAIERGAGE